MTAPFLISADSHVIEPPDLWTSRLPAKFRDRAPRHERMELGDAWVIPGTKPFPFGLNQCGGLPPEKYQPLDQSGKNVRPEANQIPAHAWPRLRVGSGVVAEVMYPSPTRSSIAVYGITRTSDPEYHLALIQRL